MPHQPLSPTVHKPLEARLWVLRVTGHDDPLLLSRVLQKCTLPATAVQAVHYAAAGETAAAQLTLVLRTTPPWADLIGAKLRKLPTVITVTWTEHSITQPTQEIC